MTTSETVTLTHADLVEATLTNADLDGTTLKNLSAETPTRVVSLSRTSRTARGIQHQQAFAVNVLSWEQRDLMRHFAVGEPHQRFDGVPYNSKRGQPVLPGTSADVVCSVKSVHEEGDHVLLVGQVVESTHTPEQTPVIYHRHHQHPVPAADGAVS
ncbi:flavin reductase family protein [Streptomyces sp. NPDC091272]|uniref:flavin reductase family protein n=1 Tax=Streptomyces sp. NPDC091272 TaxID=3365981 RepID=UPI003825D030